MTTGAAAGRRGYFHETAFYSSDEEFLTIVIPAVGVSIRQRPVRTAAVTCG